MKVRLVSSLLLFLLLVCVVLFLTPQATQAPDPKYVLKHWFCKLRCCREGKYVFLSWEHGQAKDEMLSPSFQRKLGHPFCRAGGQM